MPDLTYDILTNREQFPDDTEITLATGQKITVKQFRDTVLPKADLTRASEGWAKKERDLQGTVEALNAQLAEALNKRPPEPAKPTPQGQFTEEDLLADPVIGPIVKQQKEALARLEAHEKRLKDHEDYVLRREYTGQLANLGARFTARFNKDGKGKPWDQKAFLDYVVESQTPNLDVAYRAFTAQDEVTLSSKEAEERGVERGRAAAKVPAVPFGRRRPPARPEGLPPTFQQVTEEQLAADLEVQEAMAKDAEGG